MYLGSQRGRSSPFESMVTWHMMECETCLGGMAVLHHGTTLCVISYRPLVETQDEAQGDAKEDPEDGREEVEEEEEEAGNRSEERRVGKEC